MKPEVVEILKQIRTEGQVVFLPSTQLSRELYVEVNRCLEGIGGKWNRKVRGHVFSQDPSILLAQILETGTPINLKKEFQFFPTPEPIAQQVAELAKLKRSHKVLEPSAGDGALIRPILRKVKSIQAYEINDHCVDLLRALSIEVEKRDFLTVEPDPIYDRVLMNPPFTKQQDIDHILHAFKFLKPGGILVSLCSESPFFRNNRKAKAFREFLEGGVSIPLGVGAFKESGTNVQTRIIKKRKE